MLPDFLTHYFADQPFRTLSDLPLEHVSAVLDEIGETRELEFRLTKAEYLPRRKEIEAEMRAQFVELGGHPKRQSPHYAILGTFSLYADDPKMKRVRLPLNLFRSEMLSFTFTDSYFTFSERNLRGVAIPERPYHGHVYRLDDLPALVREFGLPGDRWRSEPAQRFDVYVEAQIWDDEPLLPVMQQRR